MAALATQTDWCSRWACTTRARLRRAKAATTPGRRSADHTAAGFGRGIIWLQPAHVGAGDSHAKMLAVWLRSSALGPSSPIVAGSGMLHRLAMLARFGSSCLACLTLRPRGGDFVACKSTPALVLGIGTRRYWRSVRVSDSPVGEHSHRDPWRRGWRPGANCPTREAAPGSTISCEPADGELVTRWLLARIRRSG